MRLEDTTPAEFLFGQLANNLLKSPSETSREVPRNTKRLSLLHSLCVFLDIFLILSTILAYNLYPTMLWYWVFMSVGVRAVIKANSGIFLLNKFGPDMRLTNNRLFPFSFTQIFISHIIFAFTSGFLYILILNIPISTPLNNIETWLLVSFIIYVLFFSDIQLAALGMGTGIINQSSGLFSMFTNFNNLSKSKGKFSAQLGILKAIVWVSGIYMIENNLYLGLAIFIGLSFYYYAKWERINASSLFMEIRGVILSSRPAILPTMILTSEGNSSLGNTSVIFPTNNRKKPKSNKPLNFGKTLKNKTKHSIGNLQPIAIQSINKIADAIKREEDQSTSSHLVEKCLSCNTEIIKTTNFCPFCGHRQN